VWNWRLSALLQLLVLNCLSPSCVVLHTFVCSRISQAKSSWTAAADPPAVLGAASNFEPATTTAKRLSLGQRKTKAGSGMGGGEGASAAAKFHSTLGFAKIRQQPPCAWPQPTAQNQNAGVATQTQQ